MLEKPEIKDEAIIDCLQNEFGLNVQKLSFLPLGADLNTAVYRIVTNDKTAYFVKLRKGDFNQASVTVPNFLSDLGIKQIIPSIKTQTGQLWALYWLLGLSVSFFGILGGNFVRRFSFSLQGGSVYTSK